MHRETIIWLGLMLATVVSTYAVDGALGQALPTLETAILTSTLLIAFVKIRFVAYEFMEIRTAPLFLRLATDVWIIATCGALLLLAPGTYSI